MGRLRSMIQGAANAAGYRIEKIRPAPPGDHIAVGDYLLHLLNEQRGGQVRFVQIGANDGLLEDPCRAWIMRYPWTGILVEPQPHLVAGLEALYAGNPRIKVRQTLISDHDGEASFFSFAGDRKDAVASIHREAIAGHRHEVGAEIVEQRLPCMRFDTLMAECGATAVDFLQVDTEGHDYTILSSIDLARWRPALIGYEHCNLSPEDNAACRAMLGKLGYAFASWLGDTIAAGPGLRIVSDNRQVFVLD